MYINTLMNPLRTIWVGLTSNYCGDANLVEDYWLEIEKTYNSPHRHYHNLSHLDDMMELAKNHKEYLIDPDTLMFSIYYHDFVYKPLNPNNEQRSANIARKRLNKLGFPPEQINKCYKQILATIDHQSTGDRDANYFLDFDMAILGSSPSRYTSYTNKIRKEFSMVPDLVYRKGRIKVICHFLNMERIFKTEEFFTRYEQQARTNLQKELDKL